MRRSSPALSQRQRRLSRKRPSSFHQNNPAYLPSQLTTKQLLFLCLLGLGLLTLAANVYFLWPRDGLDPQYRRRIIPLSPSTPLLRPKTQPLHQEDSGNFLLHQDEGEEIRTKHQFEKDYLYDHQNRTTSSTNQRQEQDITSLRGHDRIRAIFAEAGIVLDDELLSEMPTWEEIVDLVGDTPRIHGLERCPDFRRIVPATERNLGAAGMFNSGTNLVTQLLKNNCKIPERVEKYGLNASREAHGIRWQVPWGKHVPANYKYQHSAKKAVLIDKESVLPIVTIRNPYDWLKSMCRNAYTARWPHNYCPHIVDVKSKQLTPLHISYDGNQEDHDSVAHLWNDWYGQYFVDAKYPYVMVRFEDLIFHSKEMTRLICECAGGEIVSHPFRYIVDSAKDGPGHGKVSARTGMVQAWMHYGRPQPVQAGFADEDYEAAVRILDGSLMETFGYSHPLARSEDAVLLH